MVIFSVQALLGEKTHPMIFPTLTHTLKESSRRHLLSSSGQLSEHGKKSGIAKVILHLKKKRYVFRQTLAYLKEEQGRRIDLGFFQIFSATWSTKLNHSGKRLTFKSFLETTALACAWKQHPQPHCALGWVPHIHGV